MPGAANGGMMGPSAGAPRGMMGGGGGGSFGGGGGIPGPRGSGPDLLAMINKGGGGVGMGGSPFGAGPGGMGMGGMGEDQTPFDMSEFPSLGGPPPGVGRGGGLGGQPGAQGAFGGPQGAFGGMGPGQGGVFGGMDGMGSMGADGYGAMALQKPHPEFTIQNEDFPALPGAPGPGGGTRVHRERASCHCRFVMKEKAKHKLQISFRVQHDIVAGLQYKNKVYKAGIPVYKVARSPAHRVCLPSPTADARGGGGRGQYKEMLGSYAPQVAVVNRGSVQ